MKHFVNHFDPCSPIKETELRKFDGLGGTWKSPTYLNPPYSEPLKWVKEAIRQSKKGVDVILLLRVDPSTEWYKLLIENKAHFCYFNERLKFNDVKGSSNFASMLVFLQPRKKEKTL